MTAEPTTTRPNRVLELFRWPDVSYRNALRMWSRNTTLFRKGWKRFVLPNFLEPILYLLSFGFGLGLYVGSQILGVEYVDFIAPGLAATSAMYGAVFELTYNVYVKLQFGHVYDAVITTPLEAEDAAAGEILWGLTRSFLYGSAFVLVMVALGHTHSWTTVFAFVALPLVGLAVGLVALIYTCLVPVIDLFTYFFNLFIIPMFLFSGVFFPIDSLPVWAQTAAWFTPLHHGVELSRSLILTGDLVAALGHAGWLLTFCLVLYPVAVNLMRRRLVV